MSTSRRQAVEDEDENHHHQQAQDREAAQPLLILTDVQEDDMEDGTIRVDYHHGLMDDKDLINFIEKYTSTNEGFHDYYLYALRDVFANSGLFSSTLWVENPVTGNFVPVRTDKPTAATQNKGNEQMQAEDEEQLENTPLIPKLDQHDLGTGKEKVLAVPPVPKLRNMDDVNNTADEWTNVRMEYRNFAFVKRAVFLIFQGLLGGFCVITVFNERAASNDVDYLSHYQPMAQEVRRYFYLLSTISLVGSIDHVITLVDFYARNNPYVQTLSAGMIRSMEDHQKISIIFSTIVVILYAICFITTMIMSSFDVQIFVKDGYHISGDAWVPQAMADSGFKSDFDDWKSMGIARTATALLAWLGCCFLLWRDISRFSKLWTNLRRVRQTAISWMKRARALEGTEELDKLSSTDLRDIVSTLEVGLQRARSALAFHEHEEFKKL